MNLKRIIFIFGNEPNPQHLEQVKLLQDSGRYNVHFIYWQRGESSITVPFSSPVPIEQLWPIKLPDPRGNKFRRIFWSMVFAMRIRSLLNKLMPAAVHVINVDMLGFGNFALLGFRRVALIYELQEQMGERLNSLYRSVYRLLLRRSDVTLIHAETMRDHLRSNGLLDSAEPVVDFSNAPLDWPVDRDVHEGRRELIVGYFGFMRGEPQIATLIEAARQVRLSERDVILKFGGAGDDADFVREQSETTDFVQFSGAFDYDKDYQRMFFDADIIFSLFPQSIPKYKGHLARRFCEAMACGMPVIVAKGSYMGGLVTEHGGGWAVDETSVEDMAALLTRVYDDRSLLLDVMPDEMRLLFRLETYRESYTQATDTAIEKRTRY